MLFQSYNKRLASRSLSCSFWRATRVLFIIRQDMDGLDDANKGVKSKHGNVTAGPPHKKQRVTVLVPSSSPLEDATPVSVIKRRTVQYGQGLTSPQTQSFDQAVVGPSQDKPMPNVLVPTSSPFTPVSAKCYYCVRESHTRTDADGALFFLKPQADGRHSQKWPGHCKSCSFVFSSWSFNSGNCDHPITLRRRTENN